MKTLHAKIAELALENGFFVGRARQRGPVSERKKMIDQPAKLSVSRQGIVLGSPGAASITGHVRRRTLI
ncbi:hypothetical protein DC366_12650 [Pelagivirga sediminicola]|uniref:Uncharacterized protein n=1 Tax=Pelagivirga sediminicola TaxID=2170575 RepID=A0A2T7G558_9RHOB|nr:hypothetical protein DC366_12650 [Pelagivirga sediminicola]